jgi:hypothetical protein
LAVPVVTTLDWLELRRELIPRLCGIDKPAVVLTPMCVRSFLVRARTAMPTTSTRAPAGLAPTIAVDHPAAPEAVSAVANRLAASDLATVLKGVAAELEADVEVRQKLAEEEAPLAAELATASTPPAPFEALDEAAVELVAPVDPTAPVAPIAAAEASPPDVLQAGIAMADTMPTTTPVRGVESKDELTESPEELSPPNASESPLDPHDSDTEREARLPSPEVELTSMVSGPDPFSASSPSVNDPSGELFDAAPAATAIDANSVRSDAPEAALEESASRQAEPVFVESPAAARSEAAAGLSAPEPGPAQLATVRTDAVADHEVAPIVPIVAMVNPAVPPPPAIAEQRDQDGVAARLETTALPLPQIGTSLQRVETLLGELEQALADLAPRPTPTPSPIDLAPLVEAVQTGFERATAQDAATTVALTSLSDRIDGLGHQVEAGVQQALTARSTRTVPTHAAANPVSTPLVVAPAERTPIAMLALAALVLGWSLLFCFKAGSPRLAQGTLIVANLLGCCLLLSRRSR